MHDIFETFPFLFDTVNNPLNSARTEAENHVLEKTGGGVVCHQPSVIFSSFAISKHFGSPLVRVGEAGS